jgi:high-affinity iron transporter
LEAALIISVFLAFSRLLNFSGRWLLAAMLFGAVGAAIYAFNIDWISELQGGIGQELTNAALQMMLYGSLLVLNIFLVMRQGRDNKYLGILYTCITAGVVFAITREGSEILIFLYGIMHIPDQSASILMGAAIGAGIGLSLGVVFYYLLASLPGSRLLPIGIMLNTLVGASMVSQATQQFIQADILPSQEPVWDSSIWLSEQSVTGQLFYALLGYEATPTPLQILFYFSSIVIMLLSIALVVWCKARESRNYDLNKPA